MLGTGTMTGGGGGASVVVGATGATGRSIVVVGASVDTADEVVADVGVEVFVVVAGSTMRVVEVGDVRATGAGSSSLRPPTTDRPSTPATPIPAISGQRRFFLDSLGGRAHGSGDGIGWVTLSPLDLRAISGASSRQAGRALPNPAACQTSRFLDLDSADSPLRARCRSPDRRRDRRNRPIRLVIVSFLTMSRRSGRLRRVGGQPIRQGAAPSGEEAVRGRVSGVGFQWPSVAA